MSLGLSLASLVQFLGQASSPRGGEMVMPVGPTLSSEPPLEIWSLVTYERY